jgi:hypothetical protein
MLKRLLLVFTCIVIASFHAHTAYEILANTNIKFSDEELRIRNLSIKSGEKIDINGKDILIRLSVSSCIVGIAIGALLMQLVLVYYMKNYTKRGENP